jgi:hypothetical protein
MGHQRPVGNPVCCHVSRVSYTSHPYHKYGCKPSLGSIKIIQRLSSFIQVPYHPVSASLSHRQSPVPYCLTRYPCRSREQPLRAQNDADDQVLAQQLGAASLQRFDGEVSD